MPFVLPAYRSPDFSQPQFKDSPTVEFKAVTKAGVAPDGYHGTSIYPEYFQLSAGNQRPARLHTSRFSRGRSPRWKAVRRSPTVSA